MKVDKVLITAVVISILASTITLTNKSDTALSIKDIIKNKKVIKLYEKEEDAKLQEEAGDGNVHPFIVDKWESMR